MRSLLSIAVGAAVVLGSAGCAGEVQTRAQPSSSSSMTGGGSVTGAATGSSGTGSGAAATATQTASGRSGASPSAHPSRRSSVPPATVTLALAGDANTAWTAERALRVGVGPFSSVLSAADVAVVNLETLVVADRSGLVPEKKAYTFVTGPELVDRLADAGVDVVTAANNHSMDYRVEGMRRMLATRLRLPVVGIGADTAQAFAPWRTVVRGRHVVVLGANDVETDGLSWSATADTPGQAVISHEDGQQRLVAAVAAERAKDPDAAIVVYLHWGLEPDSCPSQRQTSLAAQLSDAGADVVAGTHTHRLQPYVTRTSSTGRTTAIAYGLGNFVFNASSPQAAPTGVLVLALPGRAAPRAAFHPGLIESGIPMPLNGAAADTAQARWRDAPTRCGVRAN